MIALSVPEVSIGVVKQPGFIRYLAHTDLGDKWFPLSGGYLPVAENPVLFGILGYTIGRATIGGVDNFQVPNYNDTVAPATFIRAWNSKGSLGRNISKPPRTQAAGGIKSHSHGGSSSSDGAHTHPAVGASLGTPSGYAGAYGASNPLRYGMRTSSLSHGSHSHSGSNTTSTQVAAANMSTRVEPRGYSVLACIYKG